MCGVCLFLGLSRSLRVVRGAAVSTSVRDRCPPPLGGLRFKNERISSSNVTLSPETNVFLASCGDRANGAPSSAIRPLFEQINLPSAYGRQYLFRRKAVRFRVSLVSSILYYMMHCIYILCMYDRLPDNLIRRKPAEASAVTSVTDTGSRVPYEHV